MSWWCVSIRVEATVVDETKLQAVYVWETPRLLLRGRSK